MSVARLLATDRITLTANLKLLERAIPIWTASHGDIEMTDSGDFGHLGRQLDVLASS